MSVRHMLVVLTGIMITFGCSALCFSTWGLFQPVVAEGLGVEITAFAMYVTVMYLTMTVASPFAGKLIQSMDIRIILTISACLVGGAFILMSFSYNIIMFYVAAVLLGLGEISILWLAIPQLINRWFAERAGFFIGLCMAFTGIGGAVWSAVFTALRSGGMDYHTIYLIWGIIALVTSIPFTLFCIRSHPSDVGLAPYGAKAVAAGAEPAKPTGISAGAAMKMPVFYALCLFAGIINVAVLIAQQFPTYTKSLTGAAFDVLVVGGIMVTVMMVGQAIFKIVLGAAADKNAKGALIFAFVCGVGGVLLCWFGSASEIMMYVGAFVFGAFYATAVVLVPIVVKQVFGLRDNAIIYSRISTVFNLIAAFASMFWAWISSGFGFNAVFIAGLIMIVAVLLLGLYSFAQAKKLRSQWTD
ncbi:MFS transporter [Eggerthella sinensis]|uniref:MFS transporter n=2 Tax=Eggerthella sinensis TaxID=242230 RepID=A0A3N0IWJ1_9ACTN|nr:MFS transporter [Eggerthella sinensis]RNM40692.1 MFS transporter [Eggerthella sinensis]